MIIGNEQRLVKGLNHEKLYKTVKFRHMLVNSFLKKLKVILDQDEYNAT